MLEPNSLENMHPTILLELRLPTQQSQGLLNVR